VLGDKYIVYKNCLKIILIAREKRCTPNCASFQILRASNCASFYPLNPYLRVFIPSLKKIAGDLDDFKIIVYTYFCLMDD